MNKKTETELHILKTAILKNVPVVEKIYLFGSMAYGKPGPQSDVDLFVVIPNADWDTIELETAIRTDVFYQKAFNYDMLFETVDTFERRRNIFELEKKVFTDGVLLYERNG
jgi:predicted nucleotidyltransferase